MASQVNGPTHLIRKYSVKTRVTCLTKTDIMKLNNNDYIPLFTISQFYSLNSLSDSIVNQKKQENHHPWRDQRVKGFAGTEWRAG